VDAIAKREVCYIDMAEPINNVSLDIVTACFNKVLASPEFSKATQCSAVLCRLHAQSVGSQSLPLNDADLATGLGLGMTPQYEAQSRSQVRTLVDKIRAKLLEYYAKRLGEPIRFEVSSVEGGYRLEVIPQSPREDLVPLIFEHRKNDSDTFSSIIRGPSADVLLVSAASRHTIDLIAPWFEADLIKVDHFRILTWRPSSDTSIAAYADHLGEQEDRIVANNKEAWNSWKKLEDEIACVEVYGYTSSLTLQSISNDECISVEIMLFNRAGSEHGFHECGTPNRRPGLFLTAAEHLAAFWLFKNSFEDLWLSAMRDAHENDVHERWRPERRKRLARRHLLPAT
jgi:hypothetical protein